MTDPQTAAQKDVGTGTYGNGPGGGLEQLRAEVARFRADHREELERLEANLQAACHAACQAERVEQDVAAVDRLIRRAYYLLSRGLAHRAAGYISEALALSARACEVARRLTAA
jgi:hypothetical protein